MYSSPDASGRRSSGRSDGKGLEVARGPGSVATTRSSSPLAISDNAFLAFRMGSRRAVGAAGVESAMHFREARPSFVPVSRWWRIEPRARCRVQRSHVAMATRAQGPAFDLLGRNSFSIRPTPATAGSRRAPARVGNDDLVEALELPNAQQAERIHLQPSLRQSRGGCRPRDRRPP